MFARTVSKAGSNGASFLRGVRHYSSEAPKPKSVEVSVTKIFGVAALAGALYAYKGMDKREEPIIKTPLYNQVEERPQKRNENYLKRYKTSFIKSYMKDRGGIGQRQYNREASAPIPINIIPTHSPYGNQFGAGIKTSELGPRKERIRYYAPPNQEQ